MRNIVLVNLLAIAVLVAGCSPTGKLLPIQADMPKCEQNNAGYEEPRATVERPSSTTLRVTARLPLNCGTESVKPLALYRPPLLQIFYDEVQSQGLFMCECQRDVVFVVDNVPESDVDVRIVSTGQVWPATVLPKADTQNDVSQGVPGVLSNFIDEPLFDEKSDPNAVKGYAVKVGLPKKHGFQQMRSFTLDPQRHPGWCFQVEPPDHKPYTVATSLRVPDDSDGVSINAPLGTVAGVVLDCSQIVLDSPGVFELDVYVNRHLAKTFKLRVHAPSKARNQSR